MAANSHQPFDGLRSSTQPDQARLCHHDQVHRRPLRLSHGPVVLRCHGCQHWNRQRPIRQHCGSSQPPQGTGQGCVRPLSSRSLSAASLPSCWMDLRICLHWPHLQWRSGLLCWGHHQYLSDAYQDEQHRREVLLTLVHSRYAIHPCTTISRLTNGLTQHPAPW